MYKRGGRRAHKKGKRGGGILGKIGQIAGAIGTKIAEKVGPKLLAEVTNPNSGLRTTVIDNLEKNSKSPWVKRLAQLNRGAKVVGLGRRKKHSRR
jgi:hypothetical protein